MEGASVHQTPIAGGMLPFPKNRKQKTKSQPYFLNNACKTPLAAAALASQ